MGLCIAMHTWLLCASTWLDASSELPDVRWHSVTVNIHGDNSKTIPLSMDQIANIDPVVFSLRLGSVPFTGCCTGRHSAVHSRAR